MESQPTKKAHLYLHFLKQRSELLEKNLLGDEAEDLILEMLDFVWGELNDAERKAINSRYNYVPIEEKGGET